MAILGLMAFFVSFIGYVKALKIIGVNQYLTWITTVMIQIIMMYVGFYLNNVVVAIWIIFGIGILLAMLSIWFNKKNSTKINAHNIWMFCLGMLFMWALYESKLDVAKIFSIHANQLLTQQRLTNDNFLGLSLFTSQMYYFSDLKPIAIVMGYFAIIWTGLYSIFAMLKDQTRTLNGFILCFAIGIIGGFSNIYLSTLSVEYILPIIGIVGLIGIKIYANNLKLQLLHVVLTTSILLIIDKISLFFVWLMIIYLALMIFKMKDKNILIRISAMLLLIASGFVLIKYYFKTSFVDIKKVLLPLNDNRLVSIGKKVIEFSIDNNAIYLIVVINVLLLISFLIIKFAMRKDNILLKSLLLFDAMLLIYVYVIACMLNTKNYLTNYDLGSYILAMTTFVILITSIVLTRSMDEALYEQNIAKRDIRGYKSMKTKIFYQNSSFVMCVLSIILMLSQINEIVFNDKLDTGENIQIEKNLVKPIKKS